MDQEIDFLHFSPKDKSVPEFFATMLGSIAPRPIAFASTMNKEGKPNLAPFSFFNGFGANPPILVFSPSRRGRDNTTKHTYNNIKELPEVVINVVSYPMVQQVSLASSDFPQGVNEFIKAGFTMEKSDLIKPFRVKESPVQYECKVLQVIETSDRGSAGNLVICEIVRVHLNSFILDQDGKIDPNKIQLVGRLGGNYYTKAFGPSLFEIEKPLSIPGIGVDSLPEHTRKSKVLTGNELGRLGNQKSIPDKDAIEQIKNHNLVSKILSDPSKRTYRELHLLCRFFLDKNEIDNAFRVLFIEF